MYHFDPNALNVSGYFWPQTATMDWCEENYVSCKYIAEFWNTISNIGFIALAAYGAWVVNQLRLGNRFVLAYLMIAFVGIGSWLFHMTLVYEMQLLDELPMVYVVCVLTYCLLSLGKTSERGRNLALGMAAESALFTWLYLAVPDPVIFLAIYTTQVVGLIIYLIILCRRIPETDVLAKRNFRSLLYMAVGSYGFGSILWGADNQLCGALRETREWVGFPASILLQLHAWWHILSGFGAHCFVMLIIGLHLRSLGRERTFSWTWQFGIIPILPVSRPIRPKSA